MNATEYNGRLAEKRDEQTILSTYESDVTGFCCLSYDEEETSQ